MKTKYFNLSAIALVAILTLFASVITNAQGTYSRRYTKRDVSNIINRVETSSDAFRRDFDRELDRSNINNTNEEDRLNNIVRNYEMALDRLRSNFDRSDNWWESRNDVRDIMKESRQVNQMMNGLSFARRLENRWNNMRSEINKLADTYDIPGLGAGNNNNNGANVARWAIGTFYARNPQTGGDITLVINADGNVLVTFENGNTQYASMTGDRFNNDGVVARVTRINNGIRMTRVDNGETIDYFQQRGNGNGNGNWNDGDGNGNANGGNVSNWAIGTFYARNPQNGGNITLTITRNGSATIMFDGGQTEYATVNGDRLRNRGVVSRITRINNGIRTTRVDNGETIDFYTSNSNNNNNGGVTGGNVPSWALGRFYARNPQTGGSITLDINREGTVTITLENGAVSYATMNGERLFNNGVEARVSRIRNGIRTTRVDNGETIDYRK